MRPRDVLLYMRYVYLRPRCYDDIVALFFDQTKIFPVDIERIARKYFHTCSRFLDRYTFRALFIDALAKYVIANPLYYSILTCGDAPCEEPLPIECRMMNLRLVRNILHAMQRKTFELRICHVGCSLMVMLFVVLGNVYIAFHRHDAQRTISILLSLVVLSIAVHVPFVYAVAKLRARCIKYESMYTTLRLKN